MISRNMKDDVGNPCSKRIAVAFTSPAAVENLHAISFNFVNGCRRYVHSRMLLTLHYVFRGCP